MHFLKKQQNLITKFKKLQSFVPQKKIHNLNYNQEDLSYIHGTSGTPLKYQTIGQLLYQQANTFPEFKAVISHEQGITKTYAELLVDAEIFAASLRKLGLKKQDRIGIYSPNNYEWLIVQLAASLADLILVNINPAYQTHELEYCLNKVNIKCLVTASKYRKSDYIHMINQICPELKYNPKPGQLNAKNAQDLKYLIRIDDEKTPGFINYKDLFEMATQKDIQDIRNLNVSDIDPNDATNIQFTSGTTGTPKGATLSHFNLLNNGYFIGHNMRLTEKDNICIPVPLYHCFGMVLGNLCSINYGSTMVYPSSIFDPIKSLQAISDYNCTGLYGVPTMFIEYIKEYENNPSKYDISKLRTGVIAGALCPPVLMEKIIDILNMNDITIAYGMTETSPISFQTKLHDTFEHRTQSVGTIFPHVEAKLVDSNGKIIKRGEQGELLVRGYNVMKGYFNDDNKTSESIDKDGWIHSGDIGQLSKEGYLKITGRIKDMIIRGGENVYPKEIEEFLMTLDGIDDAQVVGVPDPKYGEEIYAQIILKPGTQNFDVKHIYDLCRGTIAHYKIPKYVEIVEKYPVTITGKIQKFAIVDELKTRGDLSKYVIRKY